MLLNQRPIGFLTLSSVFFLSCSSPAQDSYIVSHLDSTLTSASQIEAASNLNILEALNQRKTDRRTAEKATIWMTKAQGIDSTTLSLLKYMDKLKAVVKTQRLKKVEVNELHRRIIEYKTLLLGIHERMKEITVLMNNFGPDSTPAAFNTFSTELLTNTSSINTTALLSSLQNQVLGVENKALLLCLDQTTTLDHDMFRSFEAIVAQNAKVLRSGDSIEITSGLGSFNATEKPTIVIAGKAVVVNERGIGVYKLKTAKQPGNYSIPVSVSFIDEEGMKQTRTFKVEYIITNL